MRRLVATLLLVLGVAVFLPGCKGNGMMMNKFKKEAVTAKLDKLAEKLNLDQAQKAKLEELKKTFFAKMENRTKEREAFKNEMMTEIKKDKPDMNLIADKAKGKIDEGSKDMKENIDLLVSFYNILNDDQKKMVVDKIQKKINAMETLREE